MDNELHIEDSRYLNRTKVWDNRIAFENFKVYKDYKSVGFSWRANAVKMEDARFGRQYSRSEETALLKFRQAPLPISVSTAICDTADAMMVSSEPSVYIAPIIHPFDKQKEEISLNVAKKFNYLIEKAWYDSLGNLQFDRAVRDYTNVGHGLLYVVPRNEFGEFTVDFNHLPWRYFYPDPSVTDPLYRKADNLIYAMGISKTQAFRFVKGIEPTLSMKDFERYWVNGGDVADVVNFEEDAAYASRNANTRELVFFCTRTTLEEEWIYTVVPKTKGKDLNYSATELGYRTYTKLTPELEKLQAEGRIGIKKTKKFFLTEYTSIGNLGYKVVYPVSQYNIVPMVYDHRDNPFPYSRMWYLYPLQRALNKFVMSSILNMSLLNSTRILAEENSLVNEKDWIMNASVPGVALKYRLPVPGFSKPPEVIEPKPMTDAWLQMPKWLTYMMEYISGIYSTMMGDPTGVPDVFSTVASLQSAGGLKIKRRMAAADATLSIAGEVAGEFYKEYAPLNGYTSRMKPGEASEVVTFNEVDIKQDEKTGKYLPYVKPETDLRIGFKQVRFVSHGSSGYETATETALMTHLATQMGIPELAAPIIKRMNISDADKVADDLDIGKKLRAQNEQLQNSVKELEQKAKVNMNQIEQLAVNLKAAQAKGKFDEELAKFKANPQGYIESAMASKQTNTGE